MEAYDDYVPAGDHFEFQKPFIRQATWLWRGEKTVAAAMVQTGEADIAWDVGVDSIEALPEGIVRSGGSAETFTLRVNMLWHPELKKQKVRLAMAHAINCQEVVDTLYGGYPRCLGNIIWPGVIGATEENTAPFEYNPDLARQLLQEANYNPDNLITITGRGTRIPKNVEVYEAIQGYLEDVGMNVKINIVEASVWREMRNCGIGKAVNEVLEAQGKDPSTDEPTLADMQAAIDKGGANCPIGDLMDDEPSNETLDFGRQANRYMNCRVINSLFCDPLYKFGSPAQKKEILAPVASGKKLGCFGCHEINGEDDGRSIGPDLRLEPNYHEAALQLLADRTFERLEQPAGNDDVEDADDAGSAERLARMQDLAHAVIRRPLDTRTERRRLLTMVEEDHESDAPLLSRTAHALADLLREQDAGDFRKPGPALRHIASKTTAAWIEYWTEEPTRFRPTTTMPQFFNMAEQYDPEGEDPHGQELTPVELAGIAEYLTTHSQPLDLLRPEEGYEPDPERGRRLFSRRGCLACHSHSEFPDITADFAPRLDDVHHKIKPGDEGFNWLYTWIRDPERYHPRTTMPNLFLEPEGEGENRVDPAADIAAFLLQGGDDEPARRGDYEPIELTPYLGVRTTTQRANDERPAGARVRAVLPNSPALRAVRLDNGEETRDELLVDDVVLSFGTTRVESADRLDELVDAAEVGERVSLRVLRGRDEIVLSIEIGEPLMAPVQQHYQGLVMAPQARPDTRIVPAELGGRAGAIGAGLLAGS
jgi:hypothetical protein